MIKQVIVIRKDLNMRKGKMCSQVAHASMAVILNAMTERRGNDDGRDPHHVTRTLRYEAGSDIDQWLSGKFTKIVVSVDSEAELLSLYKQAIDSDLPCSLIRDAGDTEFRNVPTYTAVAIGPAKAELIDPITGGLKLL